MNTLARNPDKLLSAALAVGVHVLFIAFLVFGLSWKTKLPDRLEVDLWSALPLPKEVEVVKPPEPKPVVPLQRVEPEERARPITEPKPEPAKADILLKEKLEKEKKKEELRKQEEAKREREKQQHLAELRQAKEKEEAEQRKRNEEEARRVQEEQAAAAANAQVVNEYIKRIQAKIRSNVRLLQDVSGNPQAEFYVVLLPGGEVLNAKLTRSSGNEAYDKAVELAIIKAQPLPLPPDRSLFQKFRELTLKFRPEN